MVYEDGNVERTIHINHAKPAKFTSSDLPELVPPTETPRHPLRYLLAGLAHRPAKPRSPAANPSVAATPPAAPAESSMPPPTTAPANHQPEPAPLRRRSPRFNPVQGHAHTIKSPPCDPDSPLFQKLQDGSHLSSHNQLQREPRQEGQSPVHRKSTVGRPPQWPQPVS